MLKIETKLSTSFYPHTDSQTERMNQELKQYLQFFIDHRQIDWPEWLVTADFVVNNKIHSATKVSLFIANYGRELQMGGRYKKERKSEKDNRVC